MMQHHDPVQLCRLDELVAGIGREYCIETQEPIKFFVLKHAAGVVAYYNVCPHTGISLNWSPGVFLSLDNARIQCSMHGALFCIKDGLCVHGPCVGARLRAVSIRIDAGYVVLCDAALLGYPIQLL